MGRGGSNRVDTKITRDGMLRLISLMRFNDAQRAVIDSYINERVLKRLQSTHPPQPVKPTLKFSSPEHTPTSNHTMSVCPTLPSPILNVDMDTRDDEGEEGENGDDCGDGTRVDNQFEKKTNNETGNNEDTSEGGLFTFVEENTPFFFHSDCSTATQTFLNAPSLCV